MMCYYACLCCLVMSSCLLCTIFVAPCLDDADAAVVEHDLVPLLLDPFAGTLGLSLSLSLSV